MKSSTRTTPPRPVRRMLRKEVYFGCPVQGCGSPYLSWHHFDPPWREKEHHNVDGMIAMCLQHHKEADGGAFTKKQLQEMKLSPYLKQEDHFPKGRFNWKREQLLVVVGGNYYFSTDVVLNVEGQKIVWLSKDDDGYEQLNVELHRADGSKMLSMKDNEWKVYVPLDDLECPPSGNSLSLRLKSEKISLDLKFLMLTRAELRSKLKSLSEKQRERFRRERSKITSQIQDDAHSLLQKQWIERMETDENLLLAPELAYRSVCDQDDENLVLCTVKTSLKWPAHIHATELYIKTHRGNMYGGNFFEGCAPIIRDGSLNV